MPTPNVNIIFQGLVALVNNLVQNAPQLGVFDFNNPTLGATNYVFDPYFQATVGGTVVQLPAPIVFCIIVQNVASSGILNITFTPTGQNPTVQTFGPGGVLCLFDPTETGGGFTQLRLVGASSTIPAAVLVAF